MKRRSLLCSSLLVALQVACLGQTSDISTGPLGRGTGRAESSAANPGSAPPIEKRLLKGLPSLSSISVWDVNDHREIVGQGRLTSGVRPWVGLYWSSPEATPVIINVPGAQCVGATGIDNLGNIVGYYSSVLCTTTGIQCSPGFSPFLRTPAGTMTYPPGVSLPGALGTSFSDINSAGEIVGNYFIDVMGVCTKRAFFRNSAGVDFDITPPGSMSADAQAITDAGRIGGKMGSTGNVCSTGWILEHGVYTSVTYPGATFTGVSGISDSRNEIVGNFGTTCPFPAPSGAYLQRGTGPFQSIPPFGPSPTNPIVLTGMNEIGDVVGLSSGALQSGAFIGLRIGPVQQR